MKRILFLFSLCLLSYVVRPQWATSGSNIYNTNAGNVGIGTSSPLWPFHVVTSGPNNMAVFQTTSSGNSWISVQNGTTWANFGIGATLAHPYLWSATGSFFIGGDGPNPTLFVSGMVSGNVGIGTTDTKGYRLAVNGSAIFTSAFVKAYSNWPDYVFTRDYRLLPLDSVSRYIEANHHLPDIPSADSVATSGLNLGEGQALLLKKIEELTLYLIEQKKELEALKERNQRLEQWIQNPKN